MKVGDVLEPKVDQAVSHDNEALVINLLIEINQGTGLTPNVWDSSKIAVIFDHRVQAESATTDSIPEY